VVDNIIANILSRLPADWGKGYSNVWLGVTVENPTFLKRVDILREIPAVIHFISAEPLLADISHGLNLDEIDWLIAGGESGPKFRHMDLDWARKLRDKAKEANAAFFFKQQAGPESGTSPWRDGKQYREFPVALPTHGKKEKVAVKEPQACMVGRGECCPSF